MSKIANVLPLAFLPLPALVVAARGKAAKIAKAAKGAALAMLSRCVAPHEPIHFHCGTRAALDAVPNSAAPQEDTRP